MTAFPLSPLRFDFIESGSGQLLCLSLILWLVAIASAAAQKCSGGGQAVYRWQHISWYNKLPEGYFIENPTAFCRAHAPANYRIQMEPVQVSNNVAYLNCLAAPPGKGFGYYDAFISREAWWQCACPMGQMLADGQCGARCPAGQSCPAKNAGDPGCTGGHKVGNPINPGIAYKIHRETDYASTQAGIGGLQLQRTYNSDDTPRRTIFGGRWIGTFDRRIVVADDKSLAVFRQDGKVLFFTLESAVWKADADVADTLVQRFDSGGAAIGWLFTSAKDHSVETYNTEGRLISLRSRAGVLQTLTYSDASTSPEIAGIPGLLIQVSDSFGRRLSLTYDITDRVRTLTDPTGAIYRYDYDYNNNIVAVSYPDSTRRVYLYNEAAHTSGADLRNALTGIVDENGSRFATYRYDTEGRAIYSERAGGANKVAISYTLAADGSVAAAAVTDALNTTRTYTYQPVMGVMKMVAASQPCGSGCSGNADSATTYDDHGNVASRTDFNGNVTTYTYDQSRNLEITRIEAFGTPHARTIHTVWGNTYRLPVRITEPGRQTTYTYDGRGNRLTKTIADTALNRSRTWTYTYNALGQILTENGPRTDISDITTYTYYSRASTVPGNSYAVGDLATVTNALGHVTSFNHYNANGQPLTIVDPNGVATTLAYDIRGRLKSRTAGGQSTAYEYDSAGSLVRITRPDASYLEYTYDAAHRLTAVADNLGNKIRYTLDLSGNRIREEIFDPDNILRNSRSRTFDNLGRLHQDIGGTDPAVQIARYGYDGNGNLTNVTDANGRATVHGYDALNRLTQVIDPAYGATAFTYDERGQLASVADPRLVLTAYTRNALDDVMRLHSPDGGTAVNSHDAAGNLIQRTDGRGIVAQYSYDALNRLVRIVYPANPAENATFIYDGTANGNRGIGRLTRYSNNAGDTALSYDGLGNVVARVDTIGGVQHTTGFAYDAANRLRSISYPSGRQVLYSRDTAGRITAVQTRGQPQAALMAVVSNVAYLPFGPVSSLTFGNGVTTTLQYDADYRMVRNSTASNPRADLIYSHDAKGNIVEQRDQAASSEKLFTYDALDRLETERGDSGYWAYKYDANGNRIGRSWTHLDNSTTVLDPVYASSSNRMIKLNVEPVVQDGAGNTTATGMARYSYNNANRLSVATMNGVSAALRYNALGQRVQLAGAKSKHYTYGLDHRYLMVKRMHASGSGDIRYEYIWLGNLPVAQIHGTYGANGITNRITYIHTDHLGAPRSMTAAGGGVVWNWGRDAFGVVPPDSDPDANGVQEFLNLRFPGQIYDSETAFNHNGFRDYDPTIGRYLQSDPIGLAGCLNTYSYAEGNPLSYKDEMGLMGYPMAPRSTSVGRSYLTVGGCVWTSCVSSDYIRGSWQGPNLDVPFPMEAGGLISLCVEREHNETCPSKEDAPIAYNVGVGRYMGFSGSSRNYCINLGFGLGSPISISIPAGLISP